MADWPGAPRLRSALEQRAAEADVDTPAKERLEETLAQSRDHPVIDFDFEQRRGRHRGRGSIIPMVIAAAAIVLVAGLALTQFADTPGTLDTTGADEPSQSEDGQSAALQTLPVVDSETICGANITTPQAYAVTVGGVTVEVGLSRPDPGNRSYPLVISVGNLASWPDQAEQVGFHESEAPVTAIYVKASDLENVEVGSLFDALIGGVCSFPQYLVMTEVGQTGEVICDGLKSFGFSGFTLADPGPPPTACRVSQPTLIISSSKHSLDIDEWASHLGCSGGAVRSDSAGNRITEYEACANTLVHVQTRAADPWVAPIDELPPADFARLIMDKAR